MAAQLPSVQECMPSHKELFYGGDWHRPLKNEYVETFNPATGSVIDRIAQAGSDDVDAAVKAAHQAFHGWRATPPAERAACLRKAADVIRQHSKELALLDALNTGNPVAEMLGDANVAAANLEYFAGLIPMIRGETIPQSEDGFHYTIRQPWGVVARIIAFNHPIMFAGARIAAPLAARNTVIVKAPDQAPLSCLRLAELLHDIFPPGVVNFLPGSVECGKALSTHPLVRKITLIGSIPTGKAIQQAAAGTLKSTLFELGGKNALLAFPDADIDKLVEGVARGMNFTWAGQSCGSTTRVFLHESHYDEVINRVCQFVKTYYVPGVPTDMATTMGPVINKTAHDRVLSYIESAKKEGAELVLGGKVPDNNPAIKDGYFIEPTIFTNVKPDMRIAREEIFGPVLSIFKWNDEEELIRLANDTNYGLTAAIYTQNMATAHRTAPRLEAGFIWVNQVGRHFLGVPFGGVKESGLGREECLDELLSFTQIKSVNVSLA
ncbi:betaine-aldehyde dehydrogenase [Xylogone sp. PMI_703]|nr:betaine-aldehyde dehydrogenase [Xylogone sp. PMI_703]